MNLKYAMSAATNIISSAIDQTMLSTMQRQQAFKYELQPNGEREHQMRRFAGSCRFVFNKALALQQERYERGEKKLGYAGLCKLLTEWRNSPETAWLSDAPVHPLQQSLKDLERAYTNFFAKRSDFPRFKKRGQHDSFRYPDPKQFRLDQTNSRIFLPKLGWVRYRNSRDVLGTVKNITVSRSDGKWFVSIQTEREVAQQVHPSESVAGIDMGIARFATVYDGKQETAIQPLNSFRKHEARLRRYQRAMARKQKFSQNWKKAKARIQHTHTRIANVRRDFLHKTSTTISQNHAIVVLEDLQVRNMSKSAMGTREVPGRNVAAKAGLNKSILDQGWAEFRRQLAYKLAWQGGELILVSPQNTSRTCPACGHVSAANRTTQARFSCVVCGYENNADLVGAINILRAGHARLACGDTSPAVGASAQEPAEATQAVSA
jgi:putative transposase